MDPTCLVVRNAVSRYLRTRVSLSRVMASALAETDPSKRPEHDGPLATTGTENPAWEDEETANRRRRRELLAAIATYLGLRDVEIDIEVVPNDGAVSFRVRDAKSGRVLYVLAEQEANGIVAILRKNHGTLVDFSA